MAVRPRHFRCRRHATGRSRTAPQVPRTALHAQVGTLLMPGASYFVCDHFSGPGGMQNGELYMTVTEQRIALIDAGYADVELVLLKGGLALHRATRASLEWQSGSARAQA